MDQAMVKAWQQNVKDRGIENQVSHETSQPTVNWWFGLVVWIPGIPLWKGLLLRGTLKIPNHQLRHEKTLITFHRILVGQWRDSYFLVYNNPYIPGITWVGFNPYFTQPTGFFSLLCSSGYFLTKNKNLMGWRDHVTSNPLITHKLHVIFTYMYHTNLPFM